MAGHIAGLGYSQRMNANGDPLAGCLLSIFETGTSTPVTSYQDYSLTIAHTHPIVADSAGIIPMFWVADGTYRVRLQDADGNEIFDDNGIVALGPSSGTGGGGSSVDENALFQTGDMLWQPIAGTRTGWVRANARTIGSAASGATERANSDAEDLFLHLWNNFSDTLCPVGGGRGGSAAADWAANKVIATIDMRSKSPLGLDDMGNTAAGITGGSTSAAAAVGASTYTIAQANLPNVSFSSTLLTIASTGITNNGSLHQGGSSDSFDSGGTGGVIKDTTLVSLSVAAGKITGGIPSGGSGTDIDILTPSRVGTYFLKL
jgi:hypothetical protein